MKGAKPIPTNIKLMRGNPGRRPMPEGEPVVPEGEIRCPPYVKGRARKFWRQHEPILKGMRVLTTADVAMLATMCETEAEFWQARADVNANGIRLKIYTKDGERWVENPAVKIASDAGKRLKALMVEFGMSPSSRTRVKAEPKKEVDPLAELLARRKA